MVAAGSGVRLGAEVPKALRTVAGRTLVRRAVDGLVAAGVDHVLVVVAVGLEGRFAEALSGVRVPVRLVPGGAERQASVANGLAALAADPTLAAARIVLVHDAARALTPPGMIRAVIGAVAAGAPGAVPVLPVVDSIREQTAGGSVVVDRAPLRIVQTPQGFDLPTLVRAHALVAERGLVVTDDAAAVEALGLPLALEAGDRRAFKVTDPFDLLVAEALLSEEVH